MRTTTGQEAGSWQQTVKQQEQHWLQTAIRHRQLDLKASDRTPAHCALELTCHASGQTPICSLKDPPHQRKRPSWLALSSLRKRILPGCLSLRQRLCQRQQRWKWKSPIRAAAAQPPLPAAAGTWRPAACPPQSLQARQPGEQAGHSQVSSWPYDAAMSSICSLLTHYAKSLPTGNSLLHMSSWS